jgi:hypothetical protein
MPLRLAVGAAPSVPGPSASPHPFLTATQRVHPHHLPSSPGPQLCTTNSDGDLINYKLNKLTKTKENNRRAKHPQCSMLPTEAGVGHLATIWARHLHAYMSLGHVPGPCTCSCPSPCSSSLPFVRSRTVVPCLVPQVGVSRVSCDWSPTCSQGPPCLHVSVE